MESLLANVSAQRTTMASPYLDFSKLSALAVQGGYAPNPQLSQITSVFLLSACVYLQERFIWQNPDYPISDAEYQQILDMLGTAQFELMRSFMIGQIIQSINELDADNLLPLDGTSVATADYPELAAVVPPAWILGFNIMLPDLNQAGLFGTTDSAEVGLMTGENEVVLTENQMPVHTHIQDIHSHSYSLTTAIPTAAGLEPTFADLTTQVPSTTGGTIATNQTSGNDEPHPNIQRSMQVYNYIVAW